MSSSSKVSGSSSFSAKRAVESVSMAGIWGQTWPVGEIGESVAVGGSGMEGATRVSGYSSSKRLIMPERVLSRKSRRTGVKM